MKKILYVDMDNVLVDFPSAIPRLPPQVALEYKGRLDDVPGIFALMDPVPHAIESYRDLADRFDAYVLSTSPWENPSAWSDKLTWIKTHLGHVAHKRLNLTHHKDLSHGHFLVDDRTKNGADRFGGELILFGSEPFPDWPSVVAYLDGKET
jgi:5'-nucleotidase